MASSKSARIAVLCGLIAILPAAAGAMTSLPPAAKAPIPTARPDDSAVPEPALAADTAAPTEADAAEVEIDAGLALLRSALEALERGDIGEARRLRATMTPGTLDHDIIAWSLAMGGDVAVGSREIEEMAAALSDWPSLATVQRNAERALYRERPDPETVITAFGPAQPQTFEGTLMLARAHVALEDEAAARAVLSPFWRTEKMSARAELAVLREFGGIIGDEDHRFRLEAMMYDDRIRSAERVAGRVGAEALVKAWAAVIRGRRDAGKLLAQVPADQRFGGYYMAKSQHLRRAGKFADAAAAVLAAPTDPAALVDPDAWWVERRVLSRELLDVGNTELAYRIAAGHAAEGPAAIADAEFHAGWYALRALRQPEKASQHFARIAEVAEGPISLARAHYWLGRCAKEGGPGDAEAEFRKAARYGTAFYGQLAAAELGEKAIEAEPPEPMASDRRRFGGRDAVHAIRRLEAAGHSDRADILYRALAAELQSAGELALLARMAERRGDHNLALRVGKIAAQRGINIGALAHPVGVIPASADIAGAGKALAYAIARQESEFNVAAVSPVGAQGLLQLLPSTARAMARRAGLSYSKPRLTTDAAYNATLGAAYLTDQLERFDGSYILTFVGYNAGPGRARQWIKRYGDPRSMDIEAAVDWIERIPFTETRNYVQRVMENYQVYKMRLTGRVDIMRDLTRGRRQG